MSAQPTGRLEQRDGTRYVVLERRFRAPIEDVWAAVTERERLERWIGTYTGDPATGAVMFRMTAESEEAPEERMAIDSCVPPPWTRRRPRASAPGGSTTSTASSPPRPAATCRASTSRRTTTRR